MYLIIYILIKDRLIKIKMYAHKKIQKPLNNDISFTDFFNFLILNKKLIAT